MGAGALALGAAARLSGFGSLTATRRCPAARMPGAM